MLEAVHDAVSRADPAHFWILATVVSVAAAAAFVGAFVILQRKRVIQGTATSRIRSAAQGYVELEGHGELLEGDPIQAPLSDTTCTWYRFKVEHKQSSHQRGRRQTRWQTVDHGTSDELFLLIDDTGRCVVDPDGAKVTPAAREVWYGNTSKPRRGPHHTPRWSLGKNYRYTEERMHPADPLYVLGLFTTAGGAGSAPPAEAELRDLIRSWKADGDTLRERFDTDGDGQVDLQEWQRVRTAAAQEVMSRRGDRSGPPAVDVVGETGDPRRPFVLAAIPQQTIIRRLQWSSAALLSFAVAAGSAVSWAITIRI